MSDSACGSAENQQLSESESTVSSTFSSESYERELDRILEAYENAAMLEYNYLLYTKFLLGTYEIGCGLSPARSFCPAITLSQCYKPIKLSFATFEWTTFIDLLCERMENFFNKPLSCCPDEYDPVIFPCGDFTKVTQLVYDGSKVLEVSRHDVSLLFTEEDVQQIIQVDTSLIKHRIYMLEQENFYSYYRSVTDLIKSWININDPAYISLNAIDLFYGFCDASNVSLLSNALREYIFFYKNNVLNDLNK